MVRADHPVVCSLPPDEESFGVGMEALHWGNGVGLPKGFAKGLMCIRS
jgi:hypothetical protein